MMFSMRIARPFPYCILLTILLLPLPQSATSQIRLPIPELAPLYAYDPSMAGRPEVGRYYKIVFDLNSPIAENNGPNPGLVIVARLLNTYAQFNIRQSHRKFLVVLRNDFVTLAEDDATYRQQHSGRQNPNAYLMQRLANAGVIFAVDGASLRKNSLSEANLQKGVQTHVSANLTFLDLEAQGFVYTSTKSLE